MANEDLIKYGCLMLEVEPLEIQKLQSELKVEDIELENGIETDSHITILYGFKEDVDVEDIKQFIKNNSVIKFTFDKIDFFRNDKFDVLKINVISEELNELNKLLREKFDVEITHKDYKPHLTISYLNSNTAEKYLYLNDILKYKDQQSSRILYSSPNKVKTRWRLDDFKKLKKLKKLN